MLNIIKTIISLFKKEDMPDLKSYVRINAHHWELGEDGNYHHSVAIPNQWNSFSTSLVDDQGQSADIHGAKIEGQDVIHLISTNKCRGVIQFKDVG